MTVRKRWDKYEAAILLDFYLRYSEGSLSKNEAIQAVYLSLLFLSRD